ncbi:MAG TPA: amino acid transporter, partial [Cyanobacteria bacterium UBA9579]|nr:amino acid transporter [Cyanobacteria bacterium UBA9579]
MSEENNPKSFTRTLNLFDATSIVAGAMIGSGIFIVSSQIARDVQSASLLLLVWLLAGIMTLIGALCYGEYAASWPDAGGQYVYIKKIWGEITGFVYGWSLFLVIQTGTIAAVAIAFAKFLGILLPIVSSSYKLASFYGLSISTQQLVAIFILVALTAVNARGVKDASFTQNIFTVAKVLALLGIVFCGIFFGLKPEVISANFSNALSAPDINISVFSAVAIAMVGAIFAADAWNNVTFIAGEIKKP